MWASRIKPGERAAEPLDPESSDGQRGGVTQLGFWLTIYNLRLEMAWIINVTLTAETHRDGGKRMRLRGRGKEMEKKQKEADEDRKREMVIMG